MPYALPRSCRHFITCALFFCEGANMNWNSTQPSFPARWRTPRKSFHSFHREAGVGLEPGVGGCWGSATLGGGLGQAPCSAYLPDAFPICRLEVVE